MPVFFSDGSSMSNTGSYVGSLSTGGSTDLPVGTIVIFSGDIETLPEDWHVCDGTEGTPNLSGRFCIRS